MRRGWRRRVCAALVCAIVLLGLALVLLHSPAPVDISCHYAPPLEPLFAPAPGPAIFFLETSCPRAVRPALDARQACAVESATRANPAHAVHVLFLSPASAARVTALRSGAVPLAAEAPLAALLTYDSVRTARLSLPEFAVGSPLEPWLATPALNRSRFGVSHASDVLRYLVLWRYPGVYLDLDVLVARSLAQLGPNWAARESDVTVAAGAISLSANRFGRALAGAILREFRATFDGAKWGNNGPGVLTRTLKRLCGTEHVPLMEPKRCREFTVYPERYFYPIPWSQWRDYTLASETDRVRNMSAHGFHVWNKISASERFHRRRLVPYTALAATLCPRVFNAVADEF